MWYKNLHTSCPLLHVHHTPAPQTSLPVPIPFLFWPKTRPLAIHFGPLFLSYKYDQVYCLWSYPLGRPSLFYCLIESISISCSVLSNSLQPHVLLLTSLCYPWDFPSKNIGVSSHVLLQVILPDSGVKPRSTALQVNSLLTFRATLKYARKVIAVHFDMHPCIELIQM